MSELIRRSWDIDVRGIDLDARSVEVVASTDTVDCYGEVLVQDWDLTRYLKNPVVLYGHNRWGYPIGHAENVRVEKNKLLARLCFVDEKANPEGERVWQGFLQKSLRAVSVGFRAKKGVSQEIDGRHIYVLSGNELIEISVVPIPANPDAVAESAKSMDIIRALVGAPAPLPSEPTAQETTMSINVKTVLAILALSDTATEAEVIDKVKSLEKRATDAEGRAKTSGEQVTKLLGEVGVDSFEKALGAIAAGKAAVAELADERKKSEQLERAKLIAEAKDAKKLTPAQEKALEGKPLEFVKGFLELQHPNPVIAAKGEKEPEDKGSDLAWNGKTWDQLKPGEKHQLFHTNKDLYVAMRDAAEKSAA